VTEASAPPDPSDPKRARGGISVGAILIGLVLGVVAALAVKATLVGPSGSLTQAELEAFTQRWIQPFGDLFMRGILVCVAPLVFTSVAAGIHGLGHIGNVGRMGGRTLVLFAITSLAAAVLATVLGNVIAPGNGLSPETRQALAASFEGNVAQRASDAQAAVKQFSGSALEVAVSIVPTNLFASLGNPRDLLGVIVFAFAFGIALLLIPREKSDPVARVLEGVYEATVAIIQLVMKIAPLGVFALVFSVVVRFGTDVLAALAFFVLTVFLGLVLHVALILLPLARFGGGYSPFDYLRRTRLVWLTAFSTSSSSATLPTTMRVAETELGIPRSVASFVLPVGSTVNMDGTTIYQVIAAYFVCQVWSIPVDVTTMISLVLVAMAMGIGAAGVPGGVIPLLYVSMASAGVPEAVIPQGIALILGVDRLLDMARSSVNVVGDLVVAKVVARAAERDERLASSAREPGSTTPSP
jgi:DAACS family dicarboxylate/amino acid:cation (Na+ or H+) symporter